MTQNGVPIGIALGVSVKFPVHKDHVGFMIGKGGGNVRRIRDKHNAQIMIQDDKTDEPYFQVRALFRKNLEGACAELVLLGNKAIDWYSNYTYYNMPLEDTYKECEVNSSFLIVHPSHVGYIIGPNGGNVRGISKQCGAFVYIQKPSVVTGGMPWFEIKGLYTKNIENAYYALMKSAMEAQTKIPLFDTTSPTMMMGPKVFPQTQQEQQQVLDSSRHEHHVGHACFAGCATELEIQRAQQAQQEQQQEQQQVLDSSRHEHHVGHACFAGCATELEIQRAQQAQQA
jgi:predicted RNA-binding protein YlqC (UPF0109 family)